MSCFIVNDKTINSVANFIMTLDQYDREPLIALGYPYEPTDEDVLRLAQSMYDLNVRSFNERWYEPGIRPFTPALLPASCDDFGHMVQVYKSLRCYLYQSCEGDCEKDPLYQALEAMGGKIAESVVMKLPEYEKAAWG